jgi:hypothetical protein
VKKREINSDDDDIPHDPEAEAEEEKERLI